MPVAHYRRQFGNPFSNIFGTGKTTATAPTATAAVSSTAPAGLPTDPLGGLTSAVASILAPPTSSVSISTTPSTTSTTSSILTTSSTPISTIPATTLEIDVTTITTPGAAQASVTSSPSPSASESAPPTSHISTVAATVAGVLIGVFALTLIVSFFLRRWNRNRSRVKPRESINFNAEEFRRTATALGDDRSEQKYMEQKVYAESAYQAPSMRAPVAAYQPGPGAYPPEYLHQQQPQQIYSPHPHQAYPTAAQQVAFEYRGLRAPPTPTSYNDMLNPHPITHPDDEAYGGI